MMDYSLVDKDLQNIAEKILKTKQKTENNSTGIKIYCSLDVFFAFHYLQSLYHDGFANLNR